MFLTTQGQSGSHHYLYSVDAFLKSDFYVSHVNIRAIYCFGVSTKSISTCAQDQPGIITVWLSPPPQLQLPSHTFCHFRLLSLLQPTLWWHTSCVSFSLESAPSERPGHCLVNQSRTNWEIYLLSMMLENYFSEKAPCKTSSWGCWNESEMNLIWLCWGPNMDEPGGQMSDSKVNSPQWD